MYILKIYSVFSIFFLILSCNSKTQNNSIEYIALETSDYLEKIKDSKDSYFIDVRTPEEYNDGRIGDAINIDFLEDSFKDKIMKLDSSKGVFIYCRSGNRSKKSFEIFKELGFKDIIDLKGGYDAYSEEN